MYSGRKCWEPSVSVQEMAGQDDCTERGEAKEDQSEEGVHKAEKRRADAAGDEANDDNEHIPLIFGCFRKNRLFQHPRLFTTSGWPRVQPVRSLQLLRNSVRNASTEPIQRSW